MRHYKIALTDVFEFEPMELKAAVIIGTGAFISKKYKSFANANFFSGTSTIGWLASEGQILDDRRNDIKFNGLYDYPKGTLIVYRDGKVYCGLMTDKQMQTIRNDIWFCCQGFNLFPVDTRKEGYDIKEVGYTTNRLAIGHNGKNIILAVRPFSNTNRAQKTLTNLGCTSGICLDSGGSVNVYNKGRALYKTNRQLTNIIYWEV
jgi:exopolysaccharide biosynthesis protein